MKKIMENKIIPILLAIVLAVGVVSPTTVSAAGRSDLGELWDSFTEKSDVTYTLSKDSRIFVISDSEPTGDLLQTVQLAQRQLAADEELEVNVGTLEIVWGSEDWAWSGDIVVGLDSSSGIAAEGYQLDVTDVAKVTASDVDGLLYGLNNLQKYLRSAGTTTITGFTAADAPDTVERTVQLDCARKYFTKDWICNFIREMSWMGYNTLSLHFSEDGGFRIDIWDPAYYKGEFQPKNDFSWICGSHVQSWVHTGYDKDPDAGKYLTTAELVEILNVAKEYHIDVIPSFDSPSHMDYLCWQFEKNYKANSGYSFTYNDTTYKASDVDGCINYCGYTGASYPEWCEYTTIDINDNTKRGKTAQAFVFQLYTDLADFFKEYAGSTDFSIGADEVNLSASQSINWSYEQFPGYINELNALLNSKGYTMRMFNDFIYDNYLDKFADNIEIMYWNSPFSPNNGANNESSILPVEKMITDDRILYNCIQTNTYYVLRVAVSNGMDARDPSNTNWTFYHSDEDSIYNEWYPADISEHGNYSEDVDDVPISQLGGGYFLLWNDYASVSTESEVWNGIGNSGNWDVIDRMWSNTIKMWNWDVNNGVSYDSFAAVRDTLGFFPGYISCSAAASLPETTAPSEATLADHSVLNMLLSSVITDGAVYTAETWATYQAAVAAAETVNNDLTATEEAIAAQVVNLTAAQEALVLKGYTVTVKFVAQTDGKALKDSETVLLNYGQRYYEIPIDAIEGYRVLNTDGTTFTNSASGDGSGSISGTVDSDITVTIIYEVYVDMVALDTALSKVYPSQGDFTDETWEAYEVALAAARAVKEKESATQEEIDTAVANLKAAQDALVIESSESTKILSIEKISEYATAGKQLGLVITTTTDVQTLVVSGQTLSMCLNNVQTLDGEDVKVWLINFPVSTPGTFEYNVVANGSIQKKVECIVK